MKILSLNVSNIRGIKHINLEPKGKNIVVFGPNGTGKSAIVDAIDFLLTGKISRLTGEGAKHLALTAHGCHIDCRENLENTIVIAKIEVDGEEVILERSIKKPSSLKVKPKKYETLIKSYLKIATLGQHVLSRKELLMYITSEAGQRAKKIMSLLNLSGIENLRAIFVYVKNKAKAELQRTESDFNIIKSEITNLLSLVNFSEKASLDKVNELREILKGDKITKLSPEKIKEKLKSRPFETRAEVLTTDQITNTANELRELIQSKDDIARQIADLTIILEEIMKEEKLKQCLLYKLYETGISLVDETNVCPLCGRQWEEGDFREYLKNKRKEVEVAEEKQEKINQLSSAIKEKVDLLKNDIDLLVKAHQQFELDILSKKELENYLALLDTWSESMLKPFETFENKKWPTSRLEEMFGASFLETNIIVPMEDIVKKSGRNVLNGASCMGYSY
jgi:predicted ATP-binding protein involved in virulence